MRKFVLIAGLLIVVAAYAAPRTVLFEEFTTYTG
jgi:hypothetical protein